MALVSPHASIDAALKSSTVKGGRAKVHWGLKAEGLSDSNMCCSGLLTLTPRWPCRDTRRAGVCCEGRVG